MRSPSSHAAEKVAAVAICVGKRRGVGREQDRNFGAVRLRLLQQRQRHAQPLQPRGREGRHLYPSEVSAEIAVTCINRMPSTSATRVALPSPVAQSNRSSLFQPACGNGRVGGAQHWLHEHRTGTCKMRMADNCRTDLS